MERSGQQMKQPIVLLLLLAAMCVVIVIVLLQQEVGQGHGFAHTTYQETMQQGGSGLERHANVRWLGLAFGVLQIGFFVGCLILGLKKDSGKAWVYFLCGIAFAAVFAWMVVADQQYAKGESTSLVLGFPLPTTLMLFGVGGVPLVFVLLYMLKFDQWILTPEDFARFEKLVEEKRKQQESTE